jgi:hypothetical protein
MPLVGGELARAAFEHGFERYGLEILAQYREMIAEKGETYLWYFPDGTPSSVENSTSPEAMPTDGWGSSAMLYAFVEGLCGIVDRGHSFRDVRCAPRWIVTGEDKAEVALSYPAGGAAFGYRYRHDPEGRTLEVAIEASRADVDLHLLLPEGSRPVAAVWDGTPVAYEHNRIEESAYVDLNGSVDGQVTVEVTYA